MELIIFSKKLKAKNIADLIDKAKNFGIDGYDLCVRDGYIVTPDNAAQMLPKLVSELSKESLSVPMISGPYDLLTVDHPAVEPIVNAMNQSGVKLLKLGYFHFYPESDKNYWQAVDRVRSELAKWENLARKHNIKVCYHTHSSPRM